MFQCLIPAFFERGSVSFGETPVPWEKMSSTLLLPEQPANTVPKPAALARKHRHSEQSRSAEGVQESDPLHPRRAIVPPSNDELAAAAHVSMAPAWQEITSRAAQKSLAVH